VVAGESWQFQVHLLTGVGTAVVLQEAVGIIIHELVWAIALNMFLAIGICYFSLTI
jgi:hypothetical protein